MAAGISIDAALSHGLTGVRRRPRDAVRIAFAIQALTVAAGALAVVVMYTADNPHTHYEAMKWVFFPAGLAWALATMWLVAFYTGVRPMRWLLALSAGGGALIIVNLLLPYGVLHREVGSIASLHTAGGEVSIMAAPAPHPLYYVVSALELAAFVVMFAAAWRVYRRGERRKAWLVTGVLALFLVGGVLDALQDYGVLADLYFTQLSFVVLVFGVSIALREETLREEAALLANRAHLETLVEQRVQDLDQANAQLALESQERLATAASLRRRVAELDALQRVSRTLADRVDLPTALDQAALEIAELVSADHARIDLAGATPAAVESTGHLIVVPLVAKDITRGALSVARDEGAPFSSEERRLVATVADDVAAAVENERLHERRTLQAAEEERQRLARDLHDAVTQTIYSAALIAEALPAVWEREPSAGLANLYLLQRLVRAALAEMRTLLYELRPATLEAAPLEALLERLGDALAGQINGQVNVRTAADLPLPPDTKLAFYRVAQEAFNNIAKHACATQVDVACVADGDGAVSLHVRDDGRGFDPVDVGPDSMGLRIMRERLDSVGALLEVRSAPGRGTTITAVWPCLTQSPAPAEEEHERSTAH
jgi:signal transduction histidine kinase